MKNPITNRILDLAGQKPLKEGYEGQTVTIKRIPEETDKRVEEVVSGVNEIINKWYDKYWEKYEEKITDDELRRQEEEAAEAKAEAQLRAREDRHRWKTEHPYYEGD